MQIIKRRARDNQLCLIMRSITSLCMSYLTMCWHPCIAGICCNIDTSLEPNVYSCVQRVDGWGGSACDEGINGYCDEPS